MSNLRWMGSLDMYRKVPVDLMEGTKRGSFLSLFAVFIMLMLFMLETGAFFRKRLITDLALDTSAEKRVRLNFNVTMMDLKCDFVVIDVVSVLGTEQNVSQHISKWHVDGEGVRKMFQGRNREQHDIALYDENIKESMDELLADGEEAISLDAKTFQFALKEQNFLFVDFYASWCSHCRDLAPTWEVLGEVMADVAESIVDEHDHDYSEEEYKEALKVELPVMIAKIDCVIHKDVCQQNSIMAYPTLRLFIDGEPWRGGDYRGHRTVTEMAHWLQSVEEVYKEEVADPNTKLHKVHESVQGFLGGYNDTEEQEWAEKIKQRKHKLKQRQWNEADHPGCQVSGHLMLDRVPGNFHIQARSPAHDMNPHMANLSHEVHQLSIGEPMGLSYIDNGKAHAPDDVKRKLRPMDGNVYVTHQLHEAYHHYLKVVTTHVEGLKVGKRQLKAYQIIQSSQLSYYRNDLVPEAKFIFDLSPVSVSYRTTSRHWYDYLTSLMAIVGGTFTVVGMLESGLYAAVNARKRTSIHRKY